MHINWKSKRKIPLRISGDAGKKKPLSFRFSDCKWVKKNSRNFSHFVEKTNITDIIRCLHVSTSEDLCFPMCKPLLSWRSKNKTKLSDISNQYEGYVSNSTLMLSSSATTPNIQQFLSDGSTFDEFSKRTSFSRSWYLCRKIGFWFLVKELVHCGNDTGQEAVPILINCQVYFYFINCFNRLNLQKLQNLPHILSTCQKNPHKVSVWEFFVSFIIAPGTIRYDFYTQQRKLFSSAASISTYYF